MTFVENFLFAKRKSFIKRIEKITINNDDYFESGILGKCPNVKEIEITNPKYKIKDGMIYSSDESELIYCPPGLEITEYTIPNKTIFT